MDILYIAGFSHDALVFSKIVEMTEQRGHSCDVLTLEEARTFDTLDVSDYDVICCHSLGAKAVLTRNWHEIVPVVFMAPVLTKTAVNVELVANMLKVAKAVTSEGVRKTLSMKTVSTPEDAELVTASFSRLDADVLTEQLKWIRKPFEYRKENTKKTVVLYATKDQVAIEKDAITIAESLNSVYLRLDTSHTIFLDEPGYVLEVIEALA